MLKIHLLTRSFSIVFASALAIGAAVPFSLVNADSAQAAEITNLTVTSTGPLTAGQVNSEPIVVSFTAPTAIPADGNNSAYVSLVGASAVTAPSGSDCTGAVTVQNDQGFTNNCSLFASPNVSTQAMGDFGASAVNWPANTTWTFTYAANTITLPYAATMNVGASTFVASSPPTNIDSTQLAVSLTGYVAPTKTVTFDANGGEGTMANQEASAATALTANSFTRSGYTFIGWNTLANGTGTAIVEAASFAFAVDQTLYAQWAAVPVTPTAATETSPAQTAAPVTPTATPESSLAKTGTSDDSSSLLSSSSWMITIGIALLLFVQLRMRSQSYIYAMNNLSNSAWKNYLSSRGRH
jgi:uncharacterized repeat protein (TIGR02543 family)